MGSAYPEPAWPWALCLYGSLSCTLPATLAATLAYSLSGGSFTVILWGRNNPLSITNVHKAHLPRIMGAVYVVVPALAFRHIAQSERVLPDFCVECIHLTQA